MQQIGLTFMGFRQWIARSAAAVNRVDPARRRFAGLLFGCVANAIPLTAATQETEPSEYGVKAAFLYKFGGYVEWPEQVFPTSEAPLRIAVVGAGEMVEALSRIASGRSVKGRKLAIESVPADDSLAGFHMVFIGRAESARLPGLLASITSSPVLTVTETAGALSHGSVINFLVIERRVRFEISMESAQRNQLKISSRLLAVAEQVETVEQ